MKYVFLRCKKQDFILKKSDLFCKKKKRKDFWFMKNHICCWKQIKRTFEDSHS